MASLRAFLVILALLFFFVAVAPVQYLLSRRGSPLAERIPLLFCRTLLRILRVSVDVAGVRASQGPLLLVVNHVSWIDILALGSMTPFCFLAKREVASWPLVSAFAKVQATVFVDRKRRRDIPPANRAMAERMRDGRIVLLFPEGTTLGDPIPGPFFSSHFAAARDFLRLVPGHDSVLLQPTALVYSSDIAAWFGDEALVPHLWRVLRGGPMRCLVTFGAPLAYGHESDRKVMAKLSREAIVDMLAAERATARPGYVWPDVIAAPGCRLPLTSPVARSSP